MRRSGRSIKRNAALATSVAALMVLAACSSTPSDNGSSSPTGEDTSAAEPGGDAEPVELTISWWGNDERAAIMTEAIDLFEVEYPHVTVVEQPVGAPDDLFNRLATDFA